MWAAVLFFLSALSGLDGPPVVFPGEDKVAHLVLYGILGATLAWASDRHPRPLPGWLLPVAGFLYGVSDEWHQSFVPGRDPSLGDLAADTAGVLLGYWLLSALLTRFAGDGGASSTS